jgi:hypothetical protein
MGVRVPEGRFGDMVKESAARARGRGLWFAPAEWLPGTSTEIAMRPFRIVLLLAWLGPLCATPSHADETLATLMDHDRLRAAAAQAEARIKAKPDDVEALVALATIRATERRFDEATKLAERAVEAGPKNPDAHYALAQVCGLEAPRASTLRKPGLARRFKKEAEATLVLAPDHEKATEALIEFYHVAPGFVGGDKKKAIALSDRLVQTHPTSGWLEKADLASSEKDTVLAESCMRKAVDAAHEPRAKIALAAWLAVPWRKPDEAERLAREALESEPWRSTRGRWWRRVRRSRSAGPISMPHCRPPSAPRPAISARTTRRRA